MSRVWLLVAAVVASLAVASAQTPDPQCQQYCGIMFSNCTSVFGAPTPANYRWCITECEIIYKFRPGSGSPTTGNTFACRWTYALQATQNKANCPHAAPWSDKCVTATVTGPSAVTIPVAPLCDNYCDKQAVLCGGRITPYINPFFSGATYIGNPLASGTTNRLDALNQCLLECSLYSNGTVHDSPLNATAGDSRNCRYYHLTLIAKNNNTYPPQVHCPHSSPAGGSPGNMVCWNPPAGVTFPPGGDFVYGACLNYCDLVTTACPGLAAGGGEAYPSYTSCMGACLSFPFVTPLVPTNPAFNMSVASGDSFECRRHWALQTIFDGVKSAGALGNCVVAGNFGGDVPAATSLPGGAGICGDACAFYCDEMNGNAFNKYQGGHCTVAQGGFADWNTCYSQCNTVLQKKRAKINQLTDPNLLTSSDTLECRAVFAGLAATPGQANAYCAAASIASAPGTCVPVPKSSTGGGSHASSTGLSGASAVQASFSVLLVACFAAFFGSRRM